MEAFLAGIARALLSLTGPIARLAWKASAIRYLDDLDEALRGPDAGSDPRVRALVRELLNAGATQKDLILLARFCRSSEGEMAFRLVAINSLTRLRQNSGLQDALETQVGALIRLFAQGSIESSLATGAAKVLVSQTALEVNRVYNAIRKRDDGLASEIRRAATDQARTPDLFRRDNLDDRSRSITELAGMLPSNLETEVREYCQLVSDENSDIKISAVGKTVSLPLMESLIAGRVERRDGSANISREDDVTVLTSLLAVHSKIVLLGDPGGGKSTAVSAAVNELARHSLTGSFAVPFVVTLRRYARSLRTNPALGILQYVTDYIQSEYDSVISINTLRYLLHTGRAIFLFDGLDEILSVDDREQVCTRITNFSRRFALAPIAVTSREIGYDEAPIFNAAYIHFVLQEFAESDIIAFSASALLHLKPDTRDRDEDHRRFLEQSREMDDVRANPLLLGILCFLFASGRSLPNNRLELYSRCADLLFGVWDESRGISNSLTDPIGAESAVRAVALQIFLSGEEEVAEDAIKRTLVEYHKNASIESSPIHAKVFADEVFTAWTGRKWILAFAGEEQGDTYYRFVHRTFLEFFAAEQIAFECETAEEAVARVRDFVDGGAATPLCQLVVQLMAKKTLGAGARMLEQFAADASEAMSRNERNRFVNIATFLTGNFAAVRTDERFRDDCLWTLIQGFSRLVPWVSIADVEHGRELPFVGYKRVVESRSQARVVHDGGAAAHSDPDSGMDDEFWDEEDLHDPDGRHIDNASTFLKSLAALSGDEQERLLAQLLRRLESTLSNAAIDERDLWLRLAMTLRQVAYFEGWSSVDEAWKGRWDGFARALWHKAKEVPLDLDNRNAGEVDFWLALALARDGSPQSGSLLEMLGPEALFVGGWPMPVVGLERGCSAHTLVLLLHGLDSSVFPISLVDTEIEALAEWLKDLQVFPGTGGSHLWSNFQAMPPTQLAVSGPLHRHRVRAAGEVMRLLSTLGDADFVRRVEAVNASRDLVD